MKCIVLAAGYATRLYPLTENFPKPLLEIGGNTILGRMLDDIDTVPQIDEVIVVTNHRFAPMFVEWADKRSEATASENLSLRSIPPTANAAGPSRSCGHGRPQVSEAVASDLEHKPITIVDDGTETNETRLGAVCDILFAMEKLRIDDDLLVVAADNILEFSLGEFVEFAFGKGTSCIMCHEQASIEKLQRSGVVELDGEFRVLGMEEKPEVPKSHWSVPPFYVYLRKDLDLVRHSVENGCGKDAPGNLARYMAAHTVMHAWPMSAGRFDIGSLDTYYEAVKKYGKN